jgi:hypothetical protein
VVIVRVEFLRFISAWGEPIAPVTVADSYFEEYADLLPETMLDLWREIGFAGCGDGLLWICDPHTWQPIVNTWLDGLDIPEPYTGTQIPIFRTAYGDIYCFKPGLGQTLTVAPAVSMILLSSPIPILTTEWLDREMEAFLELPRRMFTQTSTYMPGTDEPFQENMFERIVGRLGRTTHNTIYSFDPPRQLRGDMRAENAILAEATTELTRLRTLKTPKIDPP